MGAEYNRAATEPVLAHSQSLCISLSAQPNSPLEERKGIQPFTRLKNRKPFFARPKNSEGKEGLAASEWYLQQNYTMFSGCQIKIWKIFPMWYKYHYFDVIRVLQCL